MRLPTRGGKPVDAGDRAGRGALLLEQHQVPARRVSAAWLLSAPADEGYLESSDLRFWRAAARYAVALMLRQSVLPAAAGWTPLFRGSEVQRRAWLLAAMPAACRCALPERSAGQTLDHFLGQCLTELAALPQPPAGSLVSVHDRWLQSLTSGKPPDPADLPGLMLEVERWKQPLRLVGDARVQLAVRLRDPDLYAAEWLLEPLLQSLDDPSQLLPAAEAPHRATALAALGQAAALCPLLRSLEPIALSLPQVSGFLQSDAAALTQAGFSVFLPRWARQPAALQLRPKAAAMKSSSGLSMHDVYSFRYAATLPDGTPLTEDEIHQLARAKQTVVALRGQARDVRVTPARRRRVPYATPTPQHTGSLNAQHREQSQSERTPSNPCNH